MRELLNVAYVAQVQVKEADEIDTFDRNLSLAPGETPVANTARLRQLMGGGATRRRRKRPKQEAGGKRPPELGGSFE